MASKLKDQVWFVRIDNWHPTKLNQLLNAHFRTRSRRKQVDAAIVRGSLLGADVPRADRPRRVSLEIILGPRQRAGDPDSYWKSLLDALVKGQGLVDDSRQWCELGPVVFTRGARPATVIHLENLRKPQEGPLTEDKRLVNPKRLRLPLKQSLPLERKLDRNLLRG